jgi:hypothetical protein
VQESKDEHMRRPIIHKYPGSVSMPTFVTYGHAGFFVNKNECRDKCRDMHWLRGERSRAGASDGRPVMRRYVGAWVHEQKSCSDSNEYTDVRINGPLESGGLGEP